MAKYLLAPAFLMAENTPLLYMRKISSLLIETRNSLRQRNNDYAGIVQYIKEF